jgi:hypothetical protein
MEHLGQRLGVFLNSCTFVKNSAMNTLVIDNKSYVVLPQESYEALQKKAALKTRPEKVLSIEEARAHSKKLIRKWAGVK